MVESRNGPKKKLAEVDVNGVPVGADVLIKRVEPCDVARCSARCCRFGALLEAPEFQRTGALVPRVLPWLRPESRAVIKRSGWAFANTIRERYANPHERYHATRVAGGCCVFILDIEGGGCALHRLALEDGNRPEDYKPKECFLFPLTDAYHGSVRLHTWPGYPCTSHRRDCDLAYVELQDELTLLLGARGYIDLCQKVEQLREEDAELVPTPVFDPEPKPRGRPPKRRG